MNGHDPEDSGDDPSDARDDPSDATGNPEEAGEPSADPGDDTDRTEPTDEEQPRDWPDEWTTADDDAHSPPSDDPKATSTGSTDDTDETPTGDDATAATEEAGVRDVETTGGEPASGRSGTEDTPDLRETPAPEKPPAPGVDDEPTIEDDGFVTWFRNTNNGFVVVVRDVVSSVAAVAAIGLILFAVSGIWPPLVAVESGSMEPHMSKGDLVFLVDENRYAPQSAVDDTGVSTYRSAKAANGYSKFGNYGDVVVYRPFGDDGRTPIIHRARFHVEEGERWVQDANPEYLGSVDSCAEVPRNMCPAPYDGFITKGDANPTYDQIGDQSTIVKDDWIRGKSQVRIPLLGWIRLQFAKLALAGPSAFGPVGSLTARFGALGLGAGAAVVSTRL